MRSRLASLASAAALALLTALTIGLWPDRPARALVILPLVAGACLGALLGWRRRAWAPVPSMVLAAALGVALGLALWLARDFQPRSPRAAEILLSPPGSAAARDPLAAALAHFSARPRKDLASMPRPAGEELIRRAELALQGTFKLFEYPEAPVPLDLAWTEDPLRDSTWHWALHTMPYVEWLTDRWEATRDQRYLARAEALVLDWIDDNLRYLWRPPSAKSWHDHSTALRVRHWLPFWESWIRSPLADTREMEKLLGAIVYHARRLEDERHYTRQHNHGLEQDIALLAIAAAFPELREAERWKEVGTRRLLLQIQQTISPAGVHREHSPGYHLQVLEVLTHLQSFCQRNELHLPGLDLDGLLARMARVAAYLLQPDGFTVPVGDTTHEPAKTLSTDPSLALQSGRDPVLRFALTQGSEGTPGDDVFILREDGYAILRDWLPAPAYTQSLYLFFNAAANAGCAHKQPDDLSFHLHAHGRELIADPGHFSYDAGDPLRQYVERSSSHSTVVVDGKSFSGFTARLDRSVVFAAGAAIEAHHDNHEGLRHRRTLILIRPSTLFVVDELLPRAAEPGAGRERSFEQIFQLGIGLEATIRDERRVAAQVAAGDARQEVLWLTPLGTEGRTATIHEGEKEPLRGWVSRGHRTAVPAPLVAFHARGQTAVLATWIEIVPPAAGDRPPPGPGTECESTEGRLRLRWPEGSRTRALTLERQGGLTVALDAP